MAKLPTRTLTIRLLRKGLKPTEAFSARFAQSGDRALSTGQWNGMEGASYYIGQIFANPPGWTDFLQEGGVPAFPGLSASGAGAIVFLPVGKRFVAVCFGHIHIALTDDAFERQFGLKVTLNSVPRSQLRTLDLATPDAVTFQKRVQASRDSDLQEFGVDMLRDLARVAGGTPADPGFARFVAGKDSLSITCPVDAATLSAKCAAVLTAFAQTTYQKEYAWIDNMRVVAEKDIIAKLDAELFAALARLRHGDSSNLHMSPPEIVNYTEGSELHYNGFGSHGTTFHSLSIADYVAELNRCDFKGDIVDVKALHRVSAKGDGQAEFSEKWRVYDCFVFEASLGNPPDQEFYVLFAGLWYQVQKTFKARVDAFFNSVPRVSVIGPTRCKNEVELIAELEANRTDLLKLDRVKINPADVRHADIEPCDFLSRDKQFLHLKDGESSGPISHLWSQGVVSAEAFVTDAEFRKKLRAEVRTRRSSFAVLLPKSGEKVVREDYTVVYGIMRKPYVDGSVGLPFFSKVSLQASAERMAQLGIPLQIELIKKI